MAGARARVKVKLRVGVRARARARATATANHGEAWSGATKVDRRRAALDERVCRLQQQHVALGHERRRDRVAPAAARREVEGRNARAHQRVARRVRGRAGPQDLLDEGCGQRGAAGVALHVDERAMARQGEREALREVEGEDAALGQELRRAPQRRERLLTWVGLGIGLGLGLGLGLGIGI